MSTVLDDVTDETVDAVYVQRRVDDWVARVEGLYAELRGWLPDGWSASAGAPVRMHEEMMRRFDVAPREIPTLRLAGAADECAVLEPRGLWIVGANGRVDMRGGGASLPAGRHGGQFRETGLAGLERRAAPRPCRADRGMVQAGPSVRDLAAIVALYERLDTGLEGIRGEAAAGAGQDRVEQWQRINDQAYFVLAWGAVRSGDRGCLPGGRPARTGAPELDPSARLVALQPR